MGLATVVNVVYGVCTNSWERVSQYVAPHVRDRELIVLWNQRSITRAYNVILDAVRSRSLDMLVLLHDDLELIDPAGEEKLLAAVREPNVALVGVAGGRDVRTLAWWNHETAGYQMTDSGPLRFGPRVGDVDSVEGSLMALSPWAITNVRFDEQFVGFHGYDEIGLGIKRRGKRVVVADVDTHHHTRLGFRSEDSHIAWLRADEMFKEKYDL